MSLKMQFTLQMECHSKCNVTQNGMTFKLKCHVRWNITQNRISLKKEFLSK